MRVIVMITGSGADEDKVVAKQEMFEQMAVYNEALVKAGIMLDGEGLHPSSRGARVVFSGTGTSVVDGPFTESKEVVAGFWIWEVSSLDEAVEWAKKCPSDAVYGGSQVLEIRQIHELEDFGPEMTPELREKETALAEELAARRG